MRRCPCSIVAVLVGEAPGAAVLVGEALPCSIAASLVGEALPCSIAARLVGEALPCSMRDIPFRRC
ncbi:MAG: hypothetical protein EOS07_22125 [Mesorhizobium sp.]|nr:MAG: hypothetical protein EOS07_22125 [Mesorhizobium sp.]